MDGMDDSLANLLSAAVQSSSLLLVDDLSPGTHVQNMTADFSVFRITIQMRASPATSCCEIIADSEIMLTSEVHPGLHDIVDHVEYILVQDLHKDLQGKKG
jgi:hypothetical protein